MYRVTGGGGYFTFLWHPFAKLEPEFEFCKRFVEAEGVLMLPAKFFAPAELDGAGPNGNGEGESTAAIRELVQELDSWVRVSVANVDDDQIKEVARRLVAFSDTLKLSSGKRS